MPQKANDCHNHLKLKTKAQICYFLLFYSFFFRKSISEYTSEYTFRDLTKDIYKQLEQSDNVQPLKTKENALNYEDKSIEVTIKANGKPTTRYYRVYNIYNEKEGKNHIILNTFAPGSNHHPAQKFWDFEKKLLTAINHL
jgi:hypothetical protein